MRQLFIEIIGIALISALIETALPDGSFQKYARVVCGLFLTLALLSPFLREVSVSDFNWNVSIPTLELEAKEAEQEAEILTEHRRLLEEQVKEAVPSALPYITVNTEGKVTHLVLQGKVTEQEKSDLCEMLGITENEVEVHE